MDPNEILAECIHHRYSTVYILDQLPLQRNKTLGPDDDITSEFLDEWLVRDYSTLGYIMVRVPELSPQARLAFILHRISSVFYLDRKLTSGSK
jgi:predicted ATPase